MGRKYGLREGYSCTGKHRPRAKAGGVFLSDEAADRLDETADRIEDSGGDDAVRKMRWTEPDPNEVRGDEEDDGWGPWGPWW